MLVRSSAICLFSVLLFGCPVFSAELSSALTNKDIKKVGKILAHTSIHRSWTAPTEDPESELGAEFGLSTTFIPRSGMARMGDGHGVAPSIIPAPAFWGGWLLPADFEFSASFSPGRLYDGLTILGSALQWAFFKEEGFHVSALAHYTYLDAFGDLKAHTLGGNIQINRPLRKWEPFAGLGVLSSNVKAKASIVAPGNDRGSYTLPAIHGFLGAQFLLPAKLALQLDFANTYISGALVLGQSF